MRLKLIVFAAGAALALFAYSQGSETASQIATLRSATTLSHAEDADAGQSSEIPNIMKGGVGEVNKNLSDLKDNLQNTMDERPGRVDEQVERAK